VENYVQSKVKKNKLIFSNNLEILRQKISENHNIKYFKLSDSQAMDKIVSYLKNSGSFIEIDKRRLFKEKGEQFRKDYIEFIGRLNSANASFDWWVHNFTTKNMLATNLGQNIFYSFLIAGLLKEDSKGDLLILSDDMDLKGQLKLLAKKRKAKFVDATKDGLSLGKVTRVFPAYLLFYFLRAIKYRIVNRRFVRYKPEEKEQLVIATLINHQSFDEKGRYRDTYFGNLVDFLAERNQSPLIFGKIIGKYYEDLNRICNCSNDLDIIPIEYFLSFQDIFSCFVKSLSKFFSIPKIKGETRFNGIDVGYLIKRLIKQDFSRGYFTNLMFYYCAKAMSRKVKIKSFLYPFENRSFEKMYLFAMENPGTPSLTVGYNHASITLKHTNLFLSLEEKDIVPLPDKIITLGEIPRDILVNLGNFPEEKVSIGCGLRQTISTGITVKPKPQKISSILVVLTAEVEEYIKILTFLNKAFLGYQSEFRILIRPHPVTPLKKALELIPELKFKYEDVGGVPLANVLDDSDVVLYTSSTVGVEALAKGLPVIYLDFGDVICTDPLFDLGNFKWSVSEPSEIPQILQEINQMSLEKYQAHQKEAIDYALKFINPATEENLNKFWEMIKT